MTDEKNIKALTQKLKALEDLELPAFADLPSIDLYMDQVLGYLNPILLSVCRAQDGAPLTPNMINNYVKGGYLARPVQKKYGRDHLAMLYMLCSVKQNLSLPEASALLGDKEIATAFADISKLQTESVRQTAAEVLTVGKDARLLRKKALELALRAAAQRRIAEEILAALAPSAAGDEKKKEKGAKKAQKAKEKAAAKAAKGDRAKSGAKSK